MGGANSGRSLGARPTPAELVRVRLVEFAELMRVRLENDAGALELFPAFKALTDGLVEKLEPARWRPSLKVVRGG